MLMFAATVNLNMQSASSKTTPSFSIIFGKLLKFVHNGSPISDGITSTLEPLSTQLIKAWVVETFNAVNIVLVNSIGIYRAESFFS